jgi:hypothetical protein
MPRHLGFALLVIVGLASCDPTAPSAVQDERGSLENRIRIEGPDKPEIIKAFEAVAAAVLAHNRVVLREIEGDGPVNGPAHTAGIESLTHAVRDQQGIAKNILSAVLACFIFEKSLFTPFDEIRRQLDGMDTWTKDPALQRRGHIQIIDQQLASYDEAVGYLERGEDPLLRQNFRKHAVPDEVAAEFLRLRRETSAEVMANNLEVFREQRLALREYRQAMSTSDPVAANTHLTAARRHEGMAKQAECRLIAAIKAGIPPER